MSNSARRLFLSVLAAVTVTATAHAQTERKTLSGQSIAVYNIAGKVSIEPGTGSDVVVEITRGGRDAAKLSVSVGDVRGANALRIIYPDDDIIYPAMGRGSNSGTRIHNDGTWGDDHGIFGGRRVRVRGSGSGTEAWADLRILVPAGKRASVNILVGELAANHVNADLHLESGSGGIHTTDTKGGLHISSGSGGIDVRNASGDDMGIEVGSGGITLNGVTGRNLKIESGSGGVTGSKLSADNLNVDTGSGGIRFDDISVSGQVKLEAGSGTVRMSFLKSPKRIDVDAGSGGVTLTLPASLGAEVDIDTGSGGIDSDFAVTSNKFERNHLTGRIGDGSSRIHIESGSGSVHLKKS